MSADGCGAASSRPVVVTAVTVTYGDRWAYLSRLLELLVDTDSVAHVVVVDNGSMTSVERLVADAGFAAKVTVLTESRNVGSAAAYGRALQHVLESGAGGHVYLLDDDNLPEPGAIDRLLRRIASMKPLDLVSSLRSDRQYLVDAVMDGRELVYTRNAFCGNDVWGSMVSLGAARKTRAADALAAGGDIDSEFVPYGGMLFAIDLVKTVGYPNAGFFVYVDDYEYVWRIRRAGGRVRICADSRVRDVEKAWFDGQQDGIPAWFSPESPEFRVFYSVRNRVALERDWLVTRPTVYFAGAALMLGYLSLKALLSGAPAGLVVARLRLLIRAMKDGWSGRLGEVQLGAAGSPSGSVITANDCDQTLR